MDTGQVLIMGVAATPRREIMERKKVNGSIYITGSQYRALPVSLSVPRQRGGKRRDTPLLGKTVIIKNGPSIRTKYLMRKYFKKWLRTVYGRIHPSVARNYYRKRIITSTYYKWKDMWWAECREWKLNIRAECHNKYRLWGRVWRGWREFVDKKRRHHKLLVTANEFNYGNTCKYYMLLWTKHLKESVEERKRTNEWRDRSLKRQMFNNWVKAKYGQTLQRERHSLAVCHMKKCFMNKYYNQWVHYYKLYCTANNHYCSRLVRELFTVWMNYMSTVKERNIDKERAVSFNKYNVLHTHYIQWKCYLYKTRQAINIYSEQNNTLLRRIIIMWKQYVTDHKEQCQKKVIAHSHYMTGLKRMILNVLSVYCDQQKYYKELSQVAVSHDNMRCMYSYWRMWLQKCEHSEDIKLYSLTKRSRHHYSTRMYGIYWEKWVNYVSHQKHQMIQKQLAKQHFRKTTLPICLKAFQLNVEWCQYKRELFLSSHDFRRNILLSQFFYYWWRSSVHQFVSREAITEAVNYNQQSLLKYSFNIWKQRIYTVHYVKEMENKADIHLNVNIMKRTLNEWRMEVHDIQTKYTISSDHYNTKLLKCVLMEWKRCVTVEKECISKDGLAVTHWSGVLCMKCFNSWKTYSKCSNVKKVKGQLAIKHYYRVLVYVSFRQWHYNVQYIAKRRKLITIAIMYQRRSLELKFFNRWKRKYFIIRQCLLEENERILKVQELLNIVKLRSSFQCWIAFTKGRAVIKSAYLKAVHFHNSRILQSTFTKWCSYYQSKVNDKTMNKRSQLFNNIRLVSVYYNKWRLKFMECIVIHNQSVLSLWHWGNILQYKVLMKWREYYIDKKKQRRRYAVAMETHRHQLLVSGVSKWIEVATDIGSKRHEVAMKTNIEANSKLWNIVRKCALHWRMICRKKRNRIMTTPTLTTFNKATPTLSYWDQLVCDILPSHRPPPRCPSFVTSSLTIPQSLEPRPLEPRPSEPWPLEPYPSEPRPLEPRPSEPQPLEPCPLEPRPLEPRPSEPRPLEPRPVTPPIVPHDTLLSISTECSYHSNRPHLSIGNSTLLSPLSWQLLPPSAFTNKQKMTITKQ